MSNGRYILDYDGNPVECDLMEWAHWFETANRQLARTVIRNEIEVSTIFLGLDQSSFRMSPHQPILWETQVNSSNFDWHERYAFRQQALEGHYAIVDNIMESLPRNEPVVIEDLNGIFAKGFHTLLTKLIEEQNKRIEIGITKRRIKL